ncbi:MAG: SPOR domain-containing protein [Thermaurantiacus tibetensis]|uniref:SPOR domain-containing protein n=1 Tax=Thermaurantiacus tibetensis TaxID=2759035 RepID=UPI00188E4604|nr:SPOR domain-containing protein [Thermaurantiacus tibetensis]
MARAPSPRREAGRRQQPYSEDAPTPWLEPAEPETAEATLIGRRTLLALLVGLVLLVGIVAAGIWAVSEKADGPVDIPADGNVPLVESPGPWRVPAEGPGVEGTPVEGQGQLLFPAGEGQAPEARIDPARLPEEPVPLAEAAPTLPAEGPPTDLLPPRAGADLSGGGADGGAAGEAEGKAKTPPRPAPAAERARDPADPAQPRSAPGFGAAGPGGGATVQLGAFSSAEAARRAFRDLAARHPELKGISPAITPVERAEGPPLWRLRTTLGPDVRAGDLCDRLKVAGDACTPVR